MSLVISCSVGNRSARKVSSRVVLWSDLHFSIIPLPEVNRSSLQHFWHQGLASWKTIFPRTETGVEMICGCFEHITFTEHHRLSSTPDRQALDSHEKCARDPSHVQATVEFALLWKSSPAAHLTGHGVQVVIQAVGSGCENTWRSAPSPTTYLLLCSPVPNRPQAGGLGVGDPLCTG